MKKCVYSIVLVLFYHISLFAGENIVNVKDFGAKGNGIFDDTRMIQEAIMYGASNGKIIFFPKGTYIVSTLHINASIEGEKNSIIKRKRIKNHGHYDFCKLGKQDGLSIKGLIFDANSAPLKEGNTSKGIPLFIFSSKNINIEECEFVNSSMSGLRIENSSNISLNRCISRNSSGNFGDGFYFAKSKNILVKNSSSTNYTRIGFVVEDNSSDITFDNCHSSFGTNASVLKGGTEYNAGFWYENSTNIYTTNCISYKNTHRGFVASSLRKGEDVAVFFFDNCISQDNPIGFSLASKGEIPVDVMVTNSKALNVERGFVTTANNLHDKFEFKNCEVQMRKISSKGLNYIGFMWESPVSKVHKNYKELPVFIYSNVKVIYDKKEELDVIMNLKSNNGDISTYSGGKAKIIIRGFTNSLTGNKPILKARRGEPQYIQE